MPERLSPSSAAMFLECEQLFLFRMLWRLPEPSSAALLRGVLVHLTLEKMFEKIERPHRNRDSLRQLFRELWLSKRTEELLKDLFPTVESERTWGLECFGLLDNYLSFEDPNAVEEMVVEREAWLSTRIPTNSVHLQLVGKLDRLDRIGDDLRIVDYKTAVAKSSPVERERAFFQLRCYALMLHDNQIEPNAMRILYLGGDSAVADDKPLPYDPAERHLLFDQTRHELRQVWTQIHDLVDDNDPLKFSHCSRPFCFCHIARPYVFPDCASELTPSFLSRLKVKDLRAICRSHDLNTVVPRGHDARATLTDRILHATPLQSASGLLGAEAYILQPKSVLAENDNHTHASASS